MKFGKLPENVLKRSVLRQIKTKNKEVKNGAGLGEDCAVFAFSGGREVMTCMQEGVVCAKPRGPEETTIAGLVLKCANNLAAGGATPFAFLISLILPADMEEPELKALMAQAEGACAALSAEIAGGQTRVSRAVNKSVAVVTGYGKPFDDKTSEKSGQGAGGEESAIPTADGVREKECEEKGKESDLKNAASPGQDVVLSKWAGLEGTAILAKKNREELLSRYPAYLVDEAADFDRYLSVAPEARVAAGHGVRAMHDASEGGIFGALRELAERESVGLTIDLKKIPLRQETVEVCECCQANPYELKSGGCLVMVAQDGNGLVAALAREGIPGTVVGKVTDSNDRILVNEDEVRYLDRAGQDAVYVAESVNNC